MRGFLSKKAVLVTGFFCVFSCFSSEKSDCKHTDTVFKCVEVVRVYDGDTIVVNIPDVHPIIGKKMKVRVAGIDTPEIRTKNKCEKELGKKAKAFVQEFIGNSKTIELRNLQRPKYFRLLAV